MPLRIFHCEAVAASRRWKLAATNLFPAIVFLLLGVCEAIPSGPSGPGHLRLFTSPSAIGGSLGIYPSITAPGNPYLSDAASVKRSAHLFFSDRQRSNGKRSDVLQSLEEHIFPWVIQDTNQDILGSPEVVQAALARTVFFGDFPHERTLESHLAMRHEQGLPTLRLGSIRFTSPYLLPL